MLDASFIEKIVSLAEVRGVEVGGRNYTTAKIYPNMEPEAVPLKMHTLSGLVDFCLNFTAQTFQLAHKFDRYMPVEEFVIYLQSMFVQDDTARQILKVVGNLTQGSETNVADDGITQRVTAKAGVARVAVVDLPNPVALRPYRTFLDIHQPASEFVLRIKADKDEGPLCALFETDGGAWRFTVLEHIKNYMADNLDPDRAIIIA